MSFNNKYQGWEKEYGRYERISHTLLAIIHLLLERCCIFIIRLCFPIDKSVVIFRSTPDFSDNARALADYMVENDYTKKYKIYFDVEDINKYSHRTGNVNFISCKAKYGRYKLSSLLRLYTAKYLMSTHGMIIAKKDARKNQFLVRLWHGCSFKDRSRQDGKKLRSFDVALVPSEFFVKTKAYFWNVDEKYILPTGYPRYDWLSMKDPTAHTLKESFKKDQDTKIILWMPTFRIDKRGKCTESNSITQFPLMDDNNRWKDLDKLCVEKNIVLIVKLHPFQTEYRVSFDCFSNIIKIENQFFDDADIPMYKFVALTDALISDYSSIGIDYLIVNRPLAFTLDDFEEYKKTRGFIVEDPRIYMPGYHLYTFEDMIMFLMDLADGKDIYKEQREHVRDKLIVSSDNYCKGILDRFCIMK